MANRTIDQSTPTLQEKRKILLRRLEHLNLLIGQVKDEITAMESELSEEDNNKMQTIAMKLGRLQKDLAYFISKQEDVEKQKQSEPLLIKEEEE